MKTALLLFLLLIAHLAAAIEINEIMYNPAGDDAGNEWVEIYTPENFDFSNWTIGDLNSNDTLVLIKSANSSFALIVENTSLFTDSNASVYYAGSTIGNGLGNTGDTIFLYNPNKTLVDSVSYNSTFANGNNKTIEKYSNSWHESIAIGGTPGYENSINSFFNINNSNISSNVSINETENNATNSTETNTTANATINETNPAECFAFLEINTTKFIYEDEAIKFRHIVNSSSDNFSIVYWVEDLFGNVVKNPYETKTLSEKSFTPHPSEKDTTYIIKSILNSCENKSAEKIVIYKTNEIAEDNPVNETTAESKKETASEENKTRFAYNLLYYDENLTQNNESKAVVEIISDNEPHQVTISAYIYKGAKKYSGISEESLTIERNDRQSVELFVSANASPGEYKLKIKINKDSQKTDYEITKNVTVFGFEESSDEIKDGKITEKSDTVNYSSTITKINITNPPVIYQSKSSETMQYVPIAIIAVLAVLSAILVWKR